MKCAKGDTFLLSVQKSTYIKEILVIHRKNHVICKHNQDVHCLTIQFSVKKKIGSVGSAKTVSKIEVITEKCTVQIEVQVSNMTQYDTIWCIVLQIIEYLRLKVLLLEWLFKLLMKRTKNT